MYIIPSRWRLIILQQGVWEVAPVSELSVEAVLIKLHTVGKGPPTDMAHRSLFTWGQKGKTLHNLSNYREASAAFEDYHFF